MPYFMPLEIHRGERYAHPDVDDLFKSFEEVEQDLVNARLHPPDPPITTLRYNYNHDQESLMWVALYIVIGRADLAGAQKIFPQIFANFLCPSRYREYFFKGAVALPSDAFHRALYPKFPIYFEMIRNHLWYICNQLEPKEEDYHKIFTTLFWAFDKLLAIVDGKPDIVPFVERSGQANVEVEEPRKKQKTEHNYSTPRRMVTRNYKKLLAGKGSNGEGLEPLRMRL